MSKIGASLEKHEELSIDLILHDKLCDLIEEGIDLQACVGQVSDSAPISRRIGATTAFLVAAPKYLKGRKTPQKPTDLQEHDCLVYHRSGRDDIWWFTSAERRLSVRTRSASRQQLGSCASRRSGWSGHRTAVAPAGRRRYQGGAPTSRDASLSACALSLNRGLSLTPKPAATYSCSDPILEPGNSSRSANEGRRRLEARLP